MKWRVESGEWRESLFGVPVLHSPLSVLHSSDDVHAVELFDGELGGGVEGAERVDNIAEELNAVGVLRGQGIDIHDTTAHGKLSTLNHEVLALEAKAL